MIKLKIHTAAVKRPMSPGQTRTVIHAYEPDFHPETGAELPDGTPAAIFLCGIEPPNSFERRFRESFHTVCSVEDMSEYPIGVSTIDEADAGLCEPGVFLYAAQENRIYINTFNPDEGLQWVPYQTPIDGKEPNRHTHKLPFFRRNTIDILLPCRDFVDQAIGWIEDAAKRLEKDFADLEKFKRYEFEQ